MLFASRLPSATVLVVVAFVLSATSYVAAQVPTLPETPKVSTFAPAEDLANQVEQYLGNLEKYVADEDSYKEATENEKIGKEANTLVILALALGLHDQENKFRANAGAMMKAAQDLAATKDFASAKKAVAALQDAAKGNANAAVALKWEKVASLPDLMKQVPNVNSKLKMNLRGKNFKSKAEATAGYSAVLAAIAQGAMADTSAAKNPDQVKKWYEWSVLGRDYAGKVNAAIHAGTEAAAQEAMEKMAKNCDDCHAVFKSGVAAGGNK